jgi:two-component system, OmpR family, KDP operon response regulator KdpE
MPNLLIIEDDHSTSIALAALLRMHGHDVSCAHTVAEALHYLRAHKPDLMLLDLGLPRIDGLDLLDAIAGEPGLATVPIVVYSGRNEPATVETARRLGACDYIVKGERWEQIYRRIEFCLNADASPDGSLHLERHSMSHTWEGREAPIWTLP